ncbi:MAG: endonuclease [Bdellovibrionaceae bacterium]|nr:endonuclease [Pseudobdellovibrionaceae bacterium]
MKHFLSFFLLIFACSAALAGPSTTVIPYYGERFYSLLRNGHSDEVKRELEIILRGTHQPTPNGLDEIGSGCSKSGCYQHTPINYTQARMLLMGQLHLVETDRNEKAIQDVYCNRPRTANELGEIPGSGRLPSDKIINVEHTWPQSKFSQFFPKEMQKTDLHHLFPTDSEINAIRGNHNFGEVQRDLLQLKCRDSRFGISNDKNEKVFEPPHVHKGNAARALMYFSVKYSMEIPPHVETVLRKWHHEDPVDAAEQERNQKIYAIQKSRNPFVDYPELVSIISDF